MSGVPPWTISSTETTSWFESYVVFSCDFDKCEGSFSQSKELQLDHKPEPEQRSFLQWRQLDESEGVSGFNWFRQFVWQFLIKLFEAWSPRSFNLISCFLIASSSHVLIGSQPAQVNNKCLCAPQKEPMNFGGTTGTVTHTLVPFFCILKLLVTNHPVSSASRIEVWSHGLCIVSAAARGVHGSWQISHLTAILLYHVVPIKWRIDNVESPTQVAARGSDKETMLNKTLCEQEYDFVTNAFT